MKTTPLGKILSSITQIGLLGLILTCMSAQAQAGPVLSPVGPDTPDPDAQVLSYGYLKVYSATEPSDSIDNEDTNFYPHSAYWIYDQAGNRLRTVQNHGLAPVEGPEMVELAPGTYIVKAWSENDGIVTVPVIIKLARTTLVRLDRAHLSDNGATTPQAPGTTKAPSVQLEEPKV